MFKLHDKVVGKKEMNIEKPNDKKLKQWIYSDDTNAMKKDQ